MTVAAVLGLLAAGRPAPAGAPTFTYSLSPPSIAVEGEPGTTYTRELSIILTTAGNPTGDGVTAWEWSLAAEGVRIIEANVRGTAGALSTDSPPGLRDPLHSFEATYLASSAQGDCEGRPGAVGAVELNLAARTQLPAEGSAVVARITVSGEIPPVIGDVARPRLLFAEGCIATTPWGSTLPAENAVTWQATTRLFDAALGCELEVRAVRLEFRRGDANDDGSVDIADALAILNCKFLGESCPACRDAADMDDDGALNISDPIRLLGFLFLGTVAPLPPGLHCGPDPSEDDYPPCIYESCSAP